MDIRSLHAPVGRGHASSSRMGHCRRLALFAQAESERPRANPTARATELRVRPRRRIRVARRGESGRDRVTTRTHWHNAPGLWRPRSPTLRHAYRVSRTCNGRAAGRGESGRESRHNPDPLGQCPRVVAPSKSLPRSPRGERSRSRWDRPLIVALTPERIVEARPLGGSGVVPGALSSCHSHSGRPTKLDRALPCVRTNQHGSRSWTTKTVPLRRFGLLMARGFTMLEVASSPTPEGRR